MPGKISNFQILLKEGEKNFETLTFGEDPQKWSSKIVILIDLAKNIFLKPKNTFIFFKTRKKQINIFSDIF